MTLKKTLSELKKFLAGWGLFMDDWSLFLHYCDILQGYNIKYGRDNHLHIIIPGNKVPWAFDKRLLDYEISIPSGSKYAKDFSRFIKKTGWDFHILVASRSLWSKLLNGGMTVYRLNGADIRMATTVGNLMHWQRSVPRWKKRHNAETVARRFIWIELLNQEAKKKGDVKVAKMTDELIRKYRPKDKSIISNVKKALSFYKNNGFIKGSVGYPGFVSGRVYLISNPDRLFKVKKGTILVTKLTSPKLLPLIKESKAVITDEGGRLSHAAVYCREFKIPCITGTKIATSVLKNGSRVEVDANQGSVRLLSQ